MMDDISLHNKISKLQSEMLKFHKKVSPKKHEGSESDAPASKDESDTFYDACTTATSELLKIGVCTFVPALIPATVFCLEGTSLLFWQVTVVCSIVALILAIAMYVNTEKVTCIIKNAFASGLSIFSKDGIIRLQSEKVMASDLLRSKIHDILYLLLLIFMWSLVSLMSYIKNIQSVLYFSLTSTGFVSGILSTVIYNILNSPDLLPFHTPRKIEMHVIPPTPEAKRKLYFTPRNTSLETSLEFPFPGSKNFDPNVQNVKLKGSDNPAKTKLSNIPPSRSQEKESNTLELPINFSTFFRRLSF